MGKKKKFSKKKEMSNAKLKKQIKAKFGDDIGAVIVNLSRHELEALLTKKINAKKLQKYSWFFAAKINHNKKRRKWLSEKLKPFKNRDEEYIFKIFKDRKPADKALAKVLKKKKKNQQWKVYERNLVTTAEANGFQNQFNY